jgi:hypothetical protein
VEFPLFDVAAVRQSLKALPPFWLVTLNTSVDRDGMTVCIVAH